MPLLYGERTKLKNAHILIATEIAKQKEKWGLEHDMQEHGSLGLAEVASILINPNPNLDAYDENQWFIKLRNKYKKDPKKRYAIAAAMLHNAIECVIYEDGAV